VQQQQHVRLSQHDEQTNLEQLTNLWSARACHRCCMQAPWHLVASTMATLCLHLAWGVCAPHLVVEAHTVCTAHVGAADSAAKG
jgi:hypothetical protein